MDSRFRGNDGSFGFVRTLPSGCGSILAFFVFFVFFVVQSIVFAFSRVLVFFVVLRGSIFVFELEHRNK
jgi:hypothetical protein